MVPDFSARRAFIVVSSWPWVRVRTRELAWFALPAGAKGGSPRAFLPASPDGGQRERALGLQCCQQSNIKSGVGLFITLGLAFSYSLTISLNRVFRSLVFAISNFAFGFKSTILPFVFCLSCLLFPFSSFMIENI